MSAVCADSASLRRRVRAARAPATSAYSASPSVATSAARPSSGTLGVFLGRELRRALRHERVLLGDERAVAELTLDRHLAVLAELVGQRAGVEHPDPGRRTALPVPQLEAEPAVVGVPLVARFDQADQRDDALLPAELAGRDGRRAAARDRRVQEEDREDRRYRERDHEPR